MEVYKIEACSLQTTNQPNSYIFYVQKFKTLKRIQYTKIKETRLIVLNNNHLIRIINIHNTGI